MTTRHGDFAFGDAERLGDQSFKGAVGFVVFGSSADAGFEIRAEIVVGAAINAVSAAGGCETDAELAQRTEPWP